MNNTDQHLRDIWDQAQKAAEMTINLPEEQRRSGLVIDSLPENIPLYEAKSFPSAERGGQGIYKPLLWAIPVIVIVIVLAATLIEQSSKNAQRQKFIELVERQRIEEERKRKEAEQKAKEERIAREAAEARRLQELEALKPAGDIEQVWVDHNVFEGGLKGMRIHVKFSVKNYRYRQCAVSVYFYYASGERLKDLNGHYQAVDGQVATNKEFVPRYRDTLYEDFKLFMPYEELHLPAGRSALKFDVQLQTRSGKLIDGSEYVPFTIR